MILGLARPLNSLISCGRYCNFSVFFVFGASWGYLEHPGASKKHKNHPDASGSAGARRTRGFLKENGRRLPFVKFIDFASFPDPAYSNETAFPFAFATGGPGTDYYLEGRIRVENDFGFKMIFKIL